MKIILLLLSLFISVLANAQDYNTRMQKAIDTWYEGNAIEASNQFESIADSSPEEWLPNYYVGLVNATMAFRIEDEEKQDQSIKKALSAIESELEKSPNNAELLVVKALSYTVYLAQAPRKNGPKYYPKVMRIYAKASKIAPENPRVALEKARFGLKSAQYTQEGTTSACKTLSKAKELFTTFKNDEAFYPDWGAERVDELMKQCK